MTAGHDLDKNMPTQTVEKVSGMVVVGDRGRCTATGEAGVTMRVQTARRGNIG